MANLRLLRKIVLQYLSCLVLKILISCTGKTVNNELDYFSNLQLSIETVIIDPGDEIIFLKYQLFGADKSIDDKYLFNFNLDDHTVEKINLDELLLEEKRPFEKEGPNGICPFIERMKVHNKHQINLNGMNQSTLFSLEGEKLMTNYFENFSIGGHPIEGGGELKPSRVLDTGANRFYGLNFLLGILHLDELEISKIVLKTFEKIPNYTFIHNLPGGSISIR